MKSFIVCAMLAVSAIQLVRGDGYDAPTESYSYNYAGGYQGSSNVATGVCGGIVVHLGILGCTDAMNDYADGGSDLNCFRACDSYVKNLVLVLKAQSAINVLEGGAVEIAAGYGASAAGGAVVGVSGAIGLLVGSVNVKAVAGAVIGTTIGGVSGSLDVVIGKLNALIQVTGHVRFSVNCAGVKCNNGYAPPSY